MGRLARLLDDGNADIQIAWVRTAASRPAGLEALFELERMLLRGGAPCGADAVGKDACGTGKQAGGNPDIVVDFTGVEREATDTARLYLRPLYNGAAGEDAALAAVLAGAILQLFAWCAAAGFGRRDDTNPLLLAVLLIAVPLSARTVGKADEAW